MSSLLPTLEKYAHGERKMGFAKLTDNKLIVALLVPLILTIAAWVSGLTALPANDLRQDQRITNVEGRTDALEKEGIRNEERQKAILDVLKEVRDDVKQMRRRER